MSQNVAVQFPSAATSAISECERTVPDHPIVGASDGLRYVMHRIDQVAPTNATVLLTGETGTGKEVIARAIHQRSLRRHRRFVVVDCGALPATLIESELFGRERGAFTGAHTSQAGRFELAHGGTVFLDEIGELPLELQPKLLRVLQDGQVDRLGSVRCTRVDVRIVAATNRNLLEEVRRGRFRQDLYYRLNVFPIALPALRERPKDLQVLVRHFCDRLGPRLGKRIDRITPDTIAALERYEWPGNVRELENVVQQGIILAEGGVLDLSTFVGEAIDPTAAPRDRDPLRRLADVECEYIRQVLDRSAWRVEGKTGAATILGLRPSTLRTRMQKHGIQRPAKPAATLPA